jgi:hypothetical protein
MDKPFDSLFDEGPDPEAQPPDQEKPRREGKRRLFMGFGIFSLIGALLVAASFLDWAILDFGDASGGKTDPGAPGGKDSAYNIQVSTGQENTAASVSNWVEANPIPESIRIPGVNKLSPGGKGATVNLPVRNESQEKQSSLTLKVDNTSEDPNDADKAYAKLLRFDYAEVDNASTTPAEWTPLGSGKFDEATGTTSISNLGDLEPREGRIVVLRVRLVNGPDADSTNAANGGGVGLQARFDGASKD